MTRKVLLGFASFLFITTTNLMAFEYSYLPPLPKNYVKSYKFAFDFLGDINSNSPKNLDYSVGLSFRKIINFESDSMFKYYSNWNRGYKGEIYYSNYNNESFLQVNLGPTLGYNVTNHLNLYIGMGIKGLIKTRDKNSTNNDTYGAGLYGEGGIEYFVNDDIVWFVNLQGAKISSSKLIGNDNKFKEVRFGFKITFR